MDEMLYDLLFKVPSLLQWDSSFLTHHSIVNCFIYFLERIKYHLYFSMIVLYMLTGSLY